MKTHCVHDHELTDENVYVAKNGARHCKTCRRERMAARRAGGPGRGGHNAAKTECKYGHEYTEENTYRGPDGRRWCRQCMRANSSTQNVQRYGISSEQLEVISEAQDHRCGICLERFGATVKRQIDHDHACCSHQGSCGKCVRGLLCVSCNHGLGKFKDDPDRLTSAVRYLEYSGTATTKILQAASMATPSTAN